MEPITLVFYSSSHTERQYTRVCHKNISNPLLKIFTELDFEVACRNQFTSLIRKQMPRFYSHILYLTWSHIIPWDHHLATGLKLLHFFNSCSGNIHEKQLLLYKSNTQKCVERWELLGKMKMFYIIIVVIVTSIYTFT